VDRFFRFFVQRHLLVNTISLAVVGLGAMTMLSVNVEGMPTIDMPRFVITATLPGASPRDVEAKITIPLEEALEEVDGLDHYTTEVTRNRSVTNIELDDDTPRELILEKEREIRQAVDGVTDFPPDMVDDPQVLRLNPALQPVFELALAGPAELLPAVADRLERRMRRIPEIGDVDVVGLPDPEMHVLLDPELARAHRVAPLDVVRALEQRNVSATGGALELASSRRQVVFWGRFESPEEVGDVILRFDPAEGVVRVRDVARIELGREDVGLIAGTNGRAGLSLVPTKKADADLIDAQVALVELIENEPMPEGVTATIVNDSSFEIRNRLGIIANNGLMGIALVAVIVFLFLAPSAAVWVCAGVPLVIMGVLALMPSFGISINIMSSIAFVVVIGLLVDDAVVVAERILLMRQDGSSPGEAAVRGATTVARPVTASAITTLLAFAPLMAIGGMPQRIVWQLPAVVCIALTLSLLESFLILPAHMSMVRRDAQPRPKRAFVLRLEAGYRMLLERWLPRRGRVIAIFGAAFLVIMFGLGPRMQFVFFPQDSSRAIYLKVKTPIGTPIEGTEAVLDALQQQLPLLMGDAVTGITARVGHQEAEGVGREYGSAENEGLISAYLDQSGTHRTAAEWLDFLRGHLRVPHDAQVVYEAAIDGPPGLEPIKVYVLANDDAVRRQVTREVYDYLAATEGVLDLDVNERPGMRELDLNIDYEKLALLGLDAEAVGRTLQTAFYGLIATEIRDISETIDVRVMFEPAARGSLQALLDTSVRNDRGELVLLRDVVDPYETPALSAIHHRDGLRAANVTGRFAADSPYTPSTLASLMEQDLLPRYAGRDDVELELEGEVVQSRSAFGGLALAFVFSVLAIGAVISIMLGSFLEAFFVIAVVPFAMAAVTLTLFVHGMHFSLLAVIGGIGLAGVVVNTAIVMIDSVHSAVQRAGRSEQERNQAMIDALVSRLRPILVTSLSTFGGVMPTAYGLGGYDTIMSPMSLAIGWGLAISTSVTLFLVPSLYVTANDWTRRIDAWRARRRGEEPKLEAVA
jgi:multidrug efflux pump subunit AcrB